MSEESSSSIRMAFGIVGLDRDHGHAPVFVVGGQLSDAALVHLRNRAVIAGEHHDQDGAR